jgi:hypothetical protein
MGKSAARHARVTHGAPQGLAAAHLIAGRRAFGRIGAVCAALLLALVLLGGAARPAGAVGVPAAYPPPAVGLQLSTSEVCPGSQMTVTGQGFAPGQVVTLTLMSTPVVLGTAGPNRAGDFSQVVTIPAGASLGSHQMVATGRSAANPGQPLTLSAQLTLACPTAVTTAPTHVLPVTGFATRAWLAASLAFILVGTALVLRAHKRRHHRAS